MAEDSPQSISIRGLSDAEAQVRLRIEGYNELPRPDRRTPLRIVLEVLREPMLALLLGGGAVYLALGDLKEALILLVFATLSVLITVVQETRTERVLEALRDLTSPRALVIRNGERRRIAGREVVRGDVVVLAEGDRVPADAVLAQSRDLQTDKSLLTGESVPVRKIARAGALRRRKFAGRVATTCRIVYSGSLVVRGTGIGEVIATGARSEIGKIGQSLSTLRPEPPRLQEETRRLVRVFAIVAGMVCGLAVLLYGSLRGGWLDAVLAGISLGMSMLPEEFPVVLTVFMAMGAWRISRAQVLTRRAAAIEILGSATVLCTDKTGTLTENRMSIAELRHGSGAVWRLQQPSVGEIPEVFHELIEFGLLASARDPFDPMESAFHQLARERLAETEHLHGSDWKLMHTYGLRPDLLATSRVWRAADGRQEFIVAAKGAPEAIGDLCRLDVAARAALMRSVDAMAADGLRVLGVARAFLSGPAWPHSQRDIAFEFVGLVGLADPLRPSVPGAVSECRSAGIRIIMITGDYPATARAIASQAGLDSGNLMTGADLERLTRGRVGAARADNDDLCADHAGPEASYRQRAQGERRDRGDDRRWRQRCTLPQSSAYRDRNGRTRDRCRARSVIDRASRRRFWLDRQGHPARTPYLRQSSEGDGIHFCSPCTDWRTGPSPAAAWIADPFCAHPHRISGNGD